MEEALLFDDENTFLNSCYDYFDKNGKLTEKQVEAVYNFINREQSKEVIRECQFDIF